MLRRLVRWLGPKVDPTQSESFIQESSSDDEFKEYLKAEIYKSPFIRPEVRDQVLEDMLKIASPRDSRHPEKRRESSVLQERIQSHLDDSALKAFDADPQKAVTAIYQRARGKHARRSDLARKRSSGITAYRPSSAGDQLECVWCLGMSGKIIPISQDFDDLAEGNCTCECCRCCLIAHIPLS